MMMTGDPSGPDRLVCVRCEREPKDIPEYVVYGKLEGMTPDEFVREQEGTLNLVNGHFACTECYIRMGQPSSPTGWVAP